MHLKERILLFSYFRGLDADLLTTFLSIAILRMYFGIFFERDKKRTLSTISWSIYFIWQMLIERINIFPTYINIIMSIILVCSICISTYVGGVLQKIVFSVLINTIWMLAEFLVGYMFVLGGIHYELPQFLGSLFSKLLTLFLILCLKFFFQSENMRNISNKYNGLLLLIPIGSMFVVYNIFILSIDMNNNIKGSLISSVIILLINIIIFKLYLILSREKELQKYNTVYEQQLELCNQHMREKETVMMNFRNARHDMKQHFIVLMEMLDNNENKSAIDYLRKLINMDILSNIGISRTDNIVVDSLINAKYSTALGYKIKFECDIHIPMQLPFWSADISILLGNILDNAIEASIQIQEEKRYIKCFMKYEKSILIITVINAFSGEVIRNRDGKIVTSKGNSTNHGIGLESVRKVTDKYNGSLVIEIKPETFIIKIILCNLPQKLQTTS